MKTLLTVLACCVVLQGSFATPAGAEEKPVWIDVRSAEEYAGGHVPGAANIPFNVIDRYIGETVEARDTEILLYCAVGGRAGVAKRVLERMGYTNVTNVGGLSEAKAIYEQ